MKTDNPVSKVKHSKAAAPVHSYQPADYFASENEQLLIAGRNAETIHHILGKTPFYIYSQEIIEKKIIRLRAQLPDRVKINYAVKANPFQPLLDKISHWVDGFDVASHQEMLAVINTGTSSQNISFAGPGKSPAELTAAIAAGVMLHVESITELQRIIGIAEQHQSIARIAIRLNPQFELKKSGMNMSGGAKPFGIDSESFPQLLIYLKSPFIRFCGFHIFSGSQNLNARALIDSHVHIFALAAQLQQQYHLKITHLNIGGGFGVPYFPGDQELDISAVGENLAVLLQQYESIISDCDVILELGRYLVADAGVYICQVIDVKSSRGTDYAIVDGGMHHHLANSGNFGQIIRKNYPLAIANKFTASAELKPVTIHGPLCTPLDIVANHVNLPEIENGDYIAVFLSGAYGKTASPGQFLGHSDCAEIFL